LKQLALEFVQVQLLAREETEEIDMVFRELDTNNDGVLSLEEIQEGYKKYYGIELTKSAVKRTFSNMDANSDGSIDYSEFLST